MNTTNTKQLFLFLLGVLLAGTVYGIRNDAAEQEGQRREGRVERSADLNFIKGNPQRAMAAYKRAYNRMKGSIWSNGANFSGIAAAWP